MVSFVIYATVSSKTERGQTGAELRHRLYNLHVQTPEQYT